MAKRITDESKRKVTATMSVPIGVLKEMDAYCHDARIARGTLVASMWRDRATTLSRDITGGYDL